MGRIRDACNLACGIAVAVLSAVISFSAIGALAGVAIASARFVLFALGA